MIVSIIMIDLVMSIDIGSVAAVTFALGERCRCTDACHLQMIPALILVVHTLSDSPAVPKLGSN